MNMHATILFTICGNDETVGQQMDGSDGVSLADTGAVRAFIDAADAVICTSKIQALGLDIEVNTDVSDNFQDWHGGRHSRLTSTLISCQVSIAPQDDDDGEISAEGWLTDTRDLERFAKLLAQVADNAEEVGLAAAHQAIVNYTA